MITVGIPAYNEGKSIGLCLGTIIYQLEPNDEVLVVSSGSTDNTEDEVRKWSNKDSRISLLVEDERRGKSSAINIINNLARGDIIVQTDADCLLEADSIKNILEPFKDSQVGAVSGNPQPIIEKDNVFYHWTRMSYRKIHELREKEDVDGTFWHLSGYLLAWRKGALSEVPFVKGAVDAWMAKIIIDNGWKIRYAPEAYVYCTAPKNTKDFIAQKARVRAGYYFLPKDNMPRTVKKELLWLPKEFLKVPIWRLHHFTYSGFVYAYSWWKGKRLAKKNKSLEEIWKIPISTK